VDEVDVRSSVINERKRESMQPIHNIYCVGRNYRLHAEELGNDVPDIPVIFSKPTHALVKADGREITLPGDWGDVHFEVEFVVYIGRAFETGMAVDDVVDGMALGVDFTLRDVQRELKKKGQPWLLAKGFPHSALITDFRPFPGTAQCLKTEFVLLKNGKTVQTGRMGDMLFDLQTIVEFIAAHVGLGGGDIIYTGTPAGVGPVSDGDRLTLRWGGETWGDCVVKLI
jgi:fumarylpyruvate hydrolase